MLLWIFVYFMGHLRKPEIEEPQWNKQEGHENLNGKRHPNTKPTKLFHSWSLEPENIAMLLILSCLFSGIS